MGGDSIPISALQHWSYCPRQCALIHVEQIFDENLYTLRGQAAHRHVDDDGSEVRAGVRIERAVPVWSERLGIHGKVDLVEFHGEVPYPIDYKHGPRRQSRHDDLQVGAYGLCLEEMLGRDVPAGAIYHHTSRRRREVVFDLALRRDVMAAIAGVREVLASVKLPAPVDDARCKDCSLRVSCMPSVVARRHQVASGVARLFAVEGDDCIP